MRFSKTVTKIITLLLVLILSLCSCAELNDALGQINGSGQNTTHPGDNETSDETSDETPDETPNETPDETPDPETCQHYVTTLKNKSDATCTEVGYSGDKLCAACGTVVTRGTEISKLNHSYTEGVCKACGAEDPDYKPPVIVGADKFDYSEVPEYSGENYVVINGNTPYFTEEEITTQSFEFYGELDDLGRCTLAYACLGKDLLPTEARPSISFKPTGWVQNTYPSNIVPQTNIYNRSHLIAWSLSGEGNNHQNLMTGTPYFNQIGMQIFENQVLDYIKETSNHVMYRVTPIFVGDNLLANGVLMEAWSVEDNGEGICFNVFMYNVQPGIEIDYATGENKLADSESDSDNSLTANLVTDISEIKSGAKIIIVAKNKDYALGEQNKNNRVAAAVTKDGNTVSFSDDVQIIIVGDGISSGTYSLGVTGGYLYAAASDSNYLRTESALTANGSWEIEIASDGTATVKATGSNTRNWLRYNAQNCLFSTYASGQTDVCIYILNEN